MFTQMKSLSQQVVIATFFVLFFITCSTKKQATKSPTVAPVAAIPKQDNKAAADSLPGEILNPTFKQLQARNIQPKRVSTQEDYNHALDSLKDMLEGKTYPDFERAVFLSENPFRNHAYDYSTFKNAISANIAIIEKMIAANDRSDSMDFDTKVNENGRFKLADIRYLPKEKKELYRKALGNWAIFKYITDTVFMNGSVFTYYHAPFAYATSDPFGMKDWANSQVMNLLFADELKGNCFALTALYKILADRLHTDAKLCTAPQHIYIQHKDPKGQYYNVELATAGHPGDGIIQTLTYTPTDAIMSGIALRDYDAKQSIGLCLVNLAKSYEHKFHTKDDAFLLRCAELVLAHDSLNLNALLLKQQVLDTRVTNYASKHKVNSITQLKKDTAIAAIVLKLEKHTALLYRLGYRQMPTQMQEMILNQYKSEPNHWNHQTKNPRPFTDIKVSDPKDQEYWTLTAGMYQEVFEPKQKETYGHFTLNTTTKNISAIDTHALKGFIIDPVAFAYDFGARMYDARIGRWLSIDPLEAMYPFLSPYTFVANKPIMFVDGDGRKIIPSNQFMESRYMNVVQKMVNNISVMPTANLYLAPFIGNTKDVYLRYHNFYGSQPGASTDIFARTRHEQNALSNTKPNEEIAFNSIAIFKIKIGEDNQPVREGDGAFHGVYVSEIFMATTVIHEFMVHATRLPGVGDDSFTKNSKLMNDMKKAILEYAKVAKITLSDKQAAALAYAGGEIDETSEFFKANGFTSKKEVINTLQSIATEGKMGSQVQSSEEYSDSHASEDKTEKPLKEKPID